MTRTDIIDLYTTRRIGLTKASGPSGRSSPNWR